MLDDAVETVTRARPAMKPSEVTQAALFAAAMTAEIAGLRRRVRVAERHWEQRQSRASRVELEVPERLVRLRAQLDEAEQLLARCKKVAKS